MRDIFKDPRTSPSKDRDPDPKPNPYPNPIPNPDHQGVQTPMLSKTRAFLPRGTLTSLNQHHPDNIVAGAPVAGGNRRASLKRDFAGNDVRGTR